MARQSPGFVDEQDLLDWVSGTPDRLKKLLREAKGAAGLEKACSYFATQFDPIEVMKVFEGTWEPKKGEQFGFAHLVQNLIDLVNAGGDDGEKKTIKKGRRKVVVHDEVSPSTRISAMMELRRIMKMMASAHPAFVKHRRANVVSGGKTVSQRDNAFEKGLRVKTA